MFVAVKDERRFRRAIAALTPRAIERFCNSWVYELTTWFPARARRLGFGYRWFLDQVEYSAAVLQFSHVIAGFRNRELREYLQRRFGLSPDEYTAAQLRYDLLKLRGKGWIRKLEGKTLYVLTPRGIIQGTALAKLNDCLNGTMHEVDSVAPHVSSPQTDVQKCYRKVRKALKQLLESLGMAA